MHPMEDASIGNFITQFLKYEVGSEEGVLAMVAQMLLEDAKLTKQVRSILDDLDIGYLSAESNIGEEEIDSMKARMRRKERCSFVVGSDLYTHPKSDNIAKLLGLIEKHTGFEVVITPPSVNTLGVSLICDLDEEVGERVIGYNEEADFVLSSIEGAGDVNLPAINQQEGTFTNMNKIVVPTNAAVTFDGFCLNDIANELGVSYKRYTIDYTSVLPVDAGYKDVEFDSLDNYFDFDGNERRGYRLHSLRHGLNNSIDEISDIESYDGTIIYLCNPNSQKDVFTNLCKYLKTDGDIVGSSQFSIAAKIQDGDLLKVDINGREVEKKFRLDSSLKGTIAMMPIFDLGFSGQLLKDGYRFSKSKIEQVDK
jgi:NADH-quinone oxidoreductase subunit G